MNAKKAKAIRCVMYEGNKKQPTTYESVLHEYETKIEGGGTYRGAKVQVVATGARRAYQLGKKIYRKFGVLPRP